MVSQVQEEICLDNQEIQGTILCKRGIFRRYYLLNPELVFSNGPEGHNEVDVDFQCIQGCKVKVLISKIP